MRGQDVVVAVKLALTPKQTYPQLSAALELSLSEVHGAVKRATAAGLVGPDRTANRTALLDFLARGLRRTFVPKRGPLTRGMPTAHGAPPLDKLVGLGAEPPPVWPDAEGAVRGETFAPLYRTAPRAARKDPRLYEALCLMDAIRGGRSRDLELAEEHLRALLLPQGSSSTAAPVSISPNTPRRQRVLRRLAERVSAGTAGHYRSALDLLALRQPVASTSHLVAHLASEIESSLRAVIGEAMPAGERGLGKKSPRERCPTCHGEVDGLSHKESIEHILHWLEIPDRGVTAQSWLALVGRKNKSAFHKRRHRDALESPRPIDWQFWSDFEGILDEVLAAFEGRYSHVFQRLDDLLQITSPTNEDAELLREALPQTEVARDYFFRKLANPSWILPLEKAGFFKRTPDPVRDDLGVKYPTPALGYLLRMAPQRPEDVARIALALPAADNDNLHVPVVWFQIALKLEPELAAKFAERAGDWLTSEAIRLPGSALADSAIELVEKLAKSGHELSAIKVLGALLKPEPPPVSETAPLFRPKPQSRLDAWNLQRAVHRLAPTIV
ncbi:MAG: hypothetical protein ABUL77_00930, partial [Bacteroidota bacterium]